MHETIKHAIEQSYGFTLSSITDGPRQFVAETYIIHTTNQQKYFVKIIKQNIYTETTIKSLPVLEQLYYAGIRNINYPIKTTSGELYIRVEDLLIIIFNFIEGEQRFGYTHAQYADLIGPIHQRTKSISAEIVKEEFEIPYKQQFELCFEQSLNPTISDDITIELKTIMNKYADEIKTDWKDFEDIIEGCKNPEFNFVLTHGDAPTNIIITANDELYLIDWDTIMLAPAERDTWFLANSQDFLEAYQKYFPGYVINKKAYKFYLYNRYFDDMQGFIEEIFSTKSEEHRRKNLEDLKKDCFEKWLRPLIRSL
jgi:spectinomycin phosphotransferase